MSKYYARYDTRITGGYWYVYKKNKFFFDKVVGTFWHPFENNIEDIYRRDVVPYMKMLEGE